MTNANALDYSTSLDELRQQLHEKLHMVMPEFEIDLKAEIAHQINLLKKEMKYQNLAKPFALVNSSQQ